MTILIIPDEKSHALLLSVAKHTVTGNVPVHLAKISDLIRIIKVSEKPSGYIYKDRSFPGNIGLS
jgi:hypothetical protein